MPIDFSDQALVLKFLTASILLFMLPVTVGSAAHAMAAAVVVVVVAIAAALISRSTRSTGYSRIKERDDALTTTSYRHSDPDAAGQVRARAPGLSIAAA
ncbi:DUF6412 domain-containing protein [Nocardia sp. NBC_01327]|uniref:DUF6412 domain-containing protein n=1 Tax=Nocardia sp. NBC_01327 TaxID=2903593 RepID=UPI002E108419|nr:DUF6412 domain-containing protein [Nocardia sp. NBC_01327]